MTFSYTGDPTTSTRDEVRFLAQDTSSTDCSISDEEIDYLLGQTAGNTYMAAAMASDIIATNYSAASASGAVKSKSVGSLSISYADKATEYRTVAKTLRRQMAVGFGGAIKPYSGGISKADKGRLEADADFDQPWFSRGMHDNPGGTREGDRPWIHHYPDST